MPGKVLIVDDEPERLAGLVRLLEAAGYGVSLAGSGADGLERVRDELPDLIVLDFMMPWMDGSEVLRRLEGDPAAAGVPILLLMVLAADAMWARRLVREANANSWLPKPIVPPRVVEHVRLLLGDAVATGDTWVLELDGRRCVGKYGELLLVQNRTFFLAAPPLRRLGVSLRTEEAAVTLSYGTRETTIPLRGAGAATEARGFRDATGQVYLPLFSLAPVLQAQVLADSHLIRLAAA